MTTIAPGASSMDDSLQQVDEEASPESVGEYAAYEAKLQEAVASVFTLPGSFGIHGSARQVIDQLDELCVDEVGNRFLFVARLVVLFEAMLLNIVYCMVIECGIGARGR